MTIGLGCMRLSTGRERDDERSVAVIHAALEAGVTLIDTADAYCRDDTETGHNERLVARALASWKGDRRRITVATKGGLRRPNGAWVNDGRARHLQQACAASRIALGADCIDLYQLHAVDPKTPIETSVRALAKLRDSGKIRDIGLCNVTVKDIRAALTITPIASVQISLSPLDDEFLRNGVAELCRDNGIRVIAYRPLGGDRLKRLLKDDVLMAVADKHRATVPQIILSWLMSFGDDVIPVPGATRVESATSIAGAVSLELDAQDRHQLDEKFSGRLLRVPRAQRRAPDNAGTDVVIVMGMPGAGKSTLAEEFKGYTRLNRDESGGALSDLLRPLKEALQRGIRHVVLDNTYPTRKSRNEVIETAWECGAPVRCVWVNTDIGRAQIHAVQRMIEVQGRLPSPEEIRARGKTDPRFLLPDALFGYERVVEPPSLEEGLTSIDCRAPETHPRFGERRALVTDFDALATTGHGEFVRSVSEGWLVFVHVWRPQVSRGEMTLSETQAEIEAFREMSGLNFDWAVCPHDAGPPVCWCRKPIPGAVVEFAMRRGVALDKSVVIGSSAADRTMAERLGASFRSAR